MTAEKLFGKHFNGLHYNDITSEMIEKYAIEFAKFHVEKALQAAADNADADIEPMGWLAEQHVSSPLIESEDYEIGINRSSILDSYPLDNIK